MGTPYMGQLLLASWNKTPRGFAQCNGQLLPVGGYSQLFTLLGSQFGGDGRSTFGLPDLRGRTPIGFSQQYLPGSSGGSETVALNATQVPGNHTHQLLGSTTAANSPNPSGNAFAVTTGSATLYAPAANLVPLNGQSISNAGGQGHENRQPFLVLNWLVALTGIYPERS